MGVGDLVVSEVWHLGVLDVGVKVLTVSTNFVFEEIIIHQNWYWGVANVNLSTNF